MLPGVTCVAAAIHTVTGQDVASNAGLAHANEQQLGQAFTHRDRADGGRRDLEVGDREPVFAMIFSLPQAASGCTEVGHVGLTDHTSNGDRATPPVRPEVSPREAGHELGVVNRMVASVGGRQGLSCDRGGSEEARGEGHSQRAQGQRGEPRPAPGTRCSLNHGECRVEVRYQSQSRRRVWVSHVFADGSRPRPSSAYICGHWQVSITPPSVRLSLRNCRCPIESLLRLSSLWLQAFS